jgi:hypothetical protein
MTIFGVCTVGGHLEGAKMSLGCFVSGCFVKAPENTIRNDSMFHFRCRWFGANGVEWFRLRPSTNSFT